MAETLQLNLAGIWTNPNQFGDKVPPGALNTADNVVIDRDSVAETRRGQFQYGILDGISDKAFSYRGSLLVHYLDRIAYDSDNNGTFIDYSGSFDPPESSLRIHSLEANQNLYITTADGVKKLDEVTGSFRAAGGITALGGTYDLENPGFMSDQVQIAYRLVWGYTDANGNEIVGVPSQRLVVINDSGDTADVELTWQIPDDITTSYFYRVYRSGESAGVTSPPDDELQQVKEGNPTSAEISAGELVFTDIVPNSLRGAFLYTDPSQEGILQANYAPPFCLDMVLFRNVVFYFNTKSKQRYFMSLVSVGDNTLSGSFGYQTNNGDTHTNTTIDGLTKAASVIIQDLTYTADTAGVAGNDISIEYTGGGTAGAEVVTVTDNAISVQIQSGVSTATQIKTAVDASGAAAALVNVTISGAGANPQTVTSQTFLEDGFDTTYLNVGMRVVGTGVQSGTTIVSIDSSSSITVTPATTATATVALVFQDAFRINNMTYWAASTADYPNRQFIAVLSETPGENIEQTALNLIEAINQDPNNSLVYAYYESGADDLPGKILIEERGIGGDEFSLTSTNGESFSPILSNTGDNNVSDNDAHQNRVMFSKSLQPEAVPLVNFLTVGSENFPILRALANRDSIFIFKETEGIFRITGTDVTNFSVSLFDSSARIRAPESAVVLNNQIFTFSDQGIVAVSENGVQIISRPIESELLRISSPQFIYFEANAFAVSYESDRKYIFFCMDEESEEWPTQAFVYNTITNTFTRWIMNRSCGIVLDSDNKLYLGNPDDLYIYKERKNFDRTDYADRELTGVLTAYSGDEITIEGNIIDFSNFSDSSGWTTVQTSGTVTFSSSDFDVTFDKDASATNSSSNNGIFRINTETVADGDVIEFTLRFNKTGSNFQYVIALSDSADISSYSAYFVGINILYFGGNYELFIRDDGVEIDPSIDLLANTLYDFRFTINSDGTMTIDYKENADSVWIEVGQNSLFNTPSMIGQPLRIACHHFFKSSTTELSNYSWSQGDSTLPDNLDGYLVKQAGTEAIIIDSLGSNVYQVSNEEIWETGEVSLFEPIATEVEWVPNTADNPGILKHFSETTVLFRDATFNDVTLGFQTDLVNEFESIDIPTVPGAGWGQFGWGEIPWGTGGGRAISLRTYVPLEMQRGSWLNFKVSNNEAYSSFALAGVSAQFESMTSRQK